MLDKDNARKLDRNKYKLINPTRFSFVNCLDQFSLQGIEKVDKLINLIPQLLITDWIYFGDCHLHEFKINKPKSNVEVKIESLVTNEVKKFNKKNKVKIKTPFVNTDLLTAGQVIDRNFKLGLSFMPNKNEGVRIDSKEYKEILSNKNYNYGNKFNFLDTAIEELEFLYEKKEKVSNDLNLVINANIDDDQYKRFNDYVNDKYIVYPYKVTEMWEIDIDYETDKKVKKKSTTLEVQYFICALDYSSTYLNQKLKITDRICDVAHLGNLSLFSRDDLSTFGKIYNNRLTTPVNIYTKIENIDKDSIGQINMVEPNMTQSKYEHEISNTLDEFVLKYNNPIPISFLPIMHNQLNDYKS